MPSEKRTASRTGTRRRRRKKRSALPLILILVILLGLLAAGALYFFQHYTLLDGNIIDKNAAELDMREKDITPETYEKLKAEFPNAVIRWKVPLGGSSYEYDAGSISLNSFSPEDLQNLSYFTGLQSIDAAQAELTPELYEQLCAALPAASVRWSVPLSGGRFPSDSESIAVRQLDASDLDLFRYFTALRTVDARECADYDVLMQLKERLPETQVLWQVSLSGVSYPQDAAELLVDDPNASAADLRAALQYLPAAQKVLVPACGWTMEERLALREAYPNVTFQWPVTICGQQYMGDETSLSFAGQALGETELEDLKTWGVYLPDVQTIDLTGCGLNAQQLRSVHETFPRAELIWELDVYGVHVRSTDTLLDFTGVKMDSTDQVEALIPIMPNLTKIDMSDTGLANENETLDAMNKRYENVRVVWTMYMGDYYIVRTDDLGFRASARYYGTFPNGCYQWFRYCEDMLCLDLGHRIEVTDLSFLEGMKNLRFLDILDCRALDLTPIQSLPKLRWLEMNRANAPSIAALVDVPSLRDLNITFMYLQSTEDTYNALMNMPFLERVWFSRAQLTEAQEAALKEAHPNIVYHVVYDWDHSNEDPWRFDKDYYDMRDILGMHYMIGMSSRAYYKIIDGVKIDLDPAFAAQQNTAEHDKDRIPLHQENHLPADWTEDD